MINHITLEKQHTSLDGECVRLNKTSLIRSYSLTRCSRWLGIRQACTDCLGAKLNITFATNIQAFHTNPAEGCSHWWWTGRPASPVAVFQNSGALTASPIVSMLARLHFRANRQCRPHVRAFQSRLSVLRIRGGRLSVWMKNRHRRLQSNVTKEIGRKNKGG